MSRNNVSITYTKATWVKMEEDGHIIDGSMLDMAMPFRQSYGSNDAIQVRATTPDGTTIWYKIRMSDIVKALTACDFKVEHRPRYTNPYLTEPRQVRQVRQVEVPDESDM